MGRAVLLERERRMREQEERQREEEERREAELANKKPKKNFSGLARLGPVMPREEDIPQFLPAPAREPSPPRRYQDGGVGRTEDADDDEEDQEKEDSVHHPSSASRAGARKVVQSEELRQRLGTGKKKKKKRVREDGTGEDWQGDDDNEEEEELVPEAMLPRKQPREGGISKQSMVVESVKGKVSHANKNLTDADLERRFQLHDHQRDTGSLMTEEEVLRLIRKERKDKVPNAGSAARRVQRELAEWETAKEVQRARVKSPHRFERMVVARK